VRKELAIKWAPDIGIIGTIAAIIEWHMHPQSAWQYGTALDLSATISLINWLCHANRRILRPTPFDSRILYSIRWNGRIVGTSGGPNPELQVRPNIGRVNKSIIGTSADNKGIY